jgi:flagellar export protein FliJ
VKPYRFRLLRLLELRRLKLQAAEADLMRALSESRAAEERAERLAREETGAAARDASRMEWTGRDLAAAQRWRESLAGRQRLALTAAEEARGRIAELRGKVREARGCVRVLESLDERRRREWERQADHEEEALAGELFLARWGR